MSFDAATFTFNAAGDSPLLQQAVARARAACFDAPVHQLHTAAEQVALRKAAATAPRLHSLAIHVTDGAADALGVDTDESYTLAVQPPIANLTAATPFGALRGLETFSQLLTAVKLDLLSGQVLFLANETKIEDNPRFPHRGLLVDTARHWLPVSALLRVINAMAWTKLNVLHWHLSDDPSFPFAPRSCPALAEGALHPSMVYSAENVQQIVRCLDPLLPPPPNAGS